MKSHDLSEQAPAPLSRRSVLGTMSATAVGLGSASLLSGRLAAQGGPPQQPAEAAVAPLALPLPLTALIGHTGTSVEDVVASATFYARLVGGKSLGGERLKDGSVRYYMQLGKGSVAIGKLGTLGSVGQTKPLIDHICVGAQQYNDPAWRARLKAEGLPYIAQAVFLDYDNIPIQVSGGQGGEGLAAGSPTRLPDLYTGEPLVKSFGFDHVMLRVSDIDRSLLFWKKFFGIDQAGRTGNVAWISDGASKIALRKTEGAEKPGIEYQAIRVAQFDEAKLKRELAALGATIGQAKPYDRTETIHFVGPDGIKAALVSAV